MVSSPGKPFEPPVWLQPDGAPLSCREKIKVLNENLEEIRELAQEAAAAFPDALYCGVDLMLRASDQAPMIIEVNAVGLLGAVGLC